MLELVHVSKNFESPGDVGSVCVLKDISFKLDGGRSMVIVGPSGSGKSTLLNIIGALDRPTQGQVLLNGQDLTQLSDNELAGIRNRQIGFVFQLHHLLPQCTVLENVLVMEEFCRKDSGIGSCLMMVNTPPEMIADFGSEKQKQD